MGQQGGLEAAHNRVHAAGVVQGKAVRPRGEEREGEGSGSEEEDPYPDGPMAEPVDAGVARADLPFRGQFNFSAILHWGEFLRADGRESIPATAPGSALQDGLACGTHLGGQDLQDFKRLERVRLHEHGELVAGDKTYFGSLASDRSQRVGLVADESG